MFLHMLHHKGITKTLHNTAQLKPKQLNMEVKKKMNSLQITFVNETIIYVALTW